MSCSLGMVAIQEEALVHSKDSAAFLDMFIKEQQVFWDALKERDSFKPQEFFTQVQVLLWLTFKYSHWSHKGQVNQDQSNERQAFT